MWEEGSVSEYINECFHVEPERKKGLQKRTYGESEFDGVSVLWVIKRESERVRARERESERERERESVS